MQIQHNFSLKKYNTFGIEAKAKEFLSVQTIEELRQELSSFGSWNGNKLVKPTVATKDAAKTSVGNAILSTWNLLLDDGALQKGEEHLAGTQRPVVAHMSEKTATDNKLENGEKVIISNSRGSITIKLEIIEMVNVGIINTTPNSVKDMHQATSLNNQNTICKFSILRYLYGILYLSFVSLFMSIFGIQIFNVG